MTCKTLDCWHSWRDLCINSSREFQWNSASICTWSGKSSDRTFGYCISFPHSLLNGPSWGKTPEQLTMCRTPFKHPEQIQQEKRGTGVFHQKITPLCQEGKLYFKINGYTKPYSKAPPIYSRFRWLCCCFNYYTEVSHHRKCNCTHSPLRKRRRRMMSLRVQKTSLMAKGFNQSSLCIHSECTQWFCPEKQTWGGCFSLATARAAG